MKKYLSRIQIFLWTLLAVVMTAFTVSASSDPPPENFNDLGTVIAAEPNPTAVLYNDGTFIFYADTPDPADEAAHSGIKTSYSGTNGWATRTFNDAYNVPWIGYTGSITAVQFKGDVKPISTAYWFYNCYKLESFIADNLNTSNVSSMKYMFEDCTKLQSLSLLSFDTSGVQDMEGMFYDCAVLSELDLSSWDVTNVLHIDKAFYKLNVNGSSPAMIYAQDWTYNQNIINANQVFANANVPNFQSGKIGGDMCKPQSMNGYFAEPQPQETNNFLGWALNDDRDNLYKAGTEIGADKADDDYTVRLKAVYNTPGSAGSTAVLYNDGTLIFYESAPDPDDETVHSGIEDSGFCVWRNIDKLTLNAEPPWINYASYIVTVLFKGTLKPKGTARWFDNCYNLKTFTPNGLDTSNVTNMSSMFADCYELKELDLSSWDVSNVTNMSNMFESCTDLTKLNLKTWDVSSVTDMNGMFNCCYNITALDLSTWDVSKVTNMSNMFRLCGKITELDFSTWDTSNVTDMNNMFNGCHDLSPVSLKNFDTSQVQDMHRMFSSCSNITELDFLSAWDTNNVTNMNGMFSSCKNLQSVSLEGFDTSQVNDISFMFYGCEVLTNVDGLDTWNVDNVKYMQYMFGDCPEILELDLSAWNVSNVVSMDSMFANCSHLQELNLSKWNPEKVQDTGLVEQRGIQHMFEGINKSGTTPAKIYAQDWTFNQSINSTDGVFSEANVPNFSSGKIGGSMCKPQSMGGYFTDPQ